MHHELAEGSQVASGKAIWLLSPLSLILATGLACIVAGKMQTLPVQLIIAAQALRKSNSAPGRGAWRSCHCTLRC